MTSFRKALMWSWAVLAAASMLFAQDQGVIEGRLVNKTDSSRPPSGVAVEVLSLMGGMNALKSAKSDATGKFHIEGLPTDAPLLVRANFLEVPYHSVVRFESGAKATVEIEVYESTASKQGIRLESAQVALKLTQAGLNAIESYTFANETRPSRSYLSEDGSLRFSKASGIAELPSVAVIAPGSTLPITQAPLESADGASYYSRYPLKPGSTTFEVMQVLPYQGGSYTYRKRFYDDVNSISIGVLPKDIVVSGTGLAKAPENAEQEFAMYAAGPFKAGTEVVWTFSGGIPVADAAAEPASNLEGPSIQSMPTSVSQNAVIIGILLLAGMLAILVTVGRGAFPADEGDRETARVQGLKECRDRWLAHIAALDARHQNGSGAARNEYLRIREQGKSQLRRIAMLLKGK
jgi:hypothetical protein